MLEIRNLRKAFGPLQVLKGIDLDVNKGDVVAILGSSGSGKTTMLRCLNFLERADAGTMDFDGRRIELHRATHAEINALRRRTGFVFQNYNLFANKTALQNVTEGLIVARKLPKEQADEIGMKMLAKVGLADRADYYPRQLSGGQQQRVAIARALAADPEIIYFDEPTSALDPELTGEVLRVLRDYDHPEQNEGVFDYVAAGWNRDGLALRAMGWLLRQRRSEQSLLLVLSDASPNDDQRIPNGLGGWAYTGKRGVDDTAAEAAALRLRGVLPVCLFTGSDREVPDARRIYGQAMERLPAIGWLADAVTRLIRGQLRRG